MRRTAIQTLISAAGVFSGYHGSGSYGMLRSTRDEREAKKRKRKLADKSRKRNRKK